MSFLGPYTQPRRDEEGLRDSYPTAVAITIRDQDNTVIVLVQAAHFFGREIKEKKVFLNRMAQCCSHFEAMGVTVQGREKPEG